MAKDRYVTLSKTKKTWLACFIVARSETGRFPSSAEASGRLGVMMVANGKRCVLRA